VQKKATILPPDPHIGNLSELINSYKQIYDMEIQRLKLENKALKEEICELKKHKKKEELKKYYTEAQVAEKLQITRQTLYNYRKKGFITPSKNGNVIRYSQQDIDNFK